MSNVKFPTSSTRSRFVDLSLPFANPPETEMHFSNDGVTFSNYEAIDYIKKNWDLFGYGGNSITGQKVVYVQFRDKLGVETEPSVVGLIFYTRPPRIRIEQPVQRTDGSNRVDIPAVVFDDNSDRVTITNQAYSLTGNFDDAKSLTFDTSDPAHDSALAIQATPSGVSVNFVWNAGADDLQAMTSSARIRLSPRFMDFAFPHFDSPLFALDTILPEEETSDLTFVRGTSAGLTVTYRNQNGNLFSPTTVQLTSVKDADGTEKLGSPVTVVATSIGVYSHAFAIAQSDVLGIWNYTYQSTTGSDVTTDVFLFKVIDKVSATETSNATGTCHVFGALRNKDGTPASDIRVNIVVTDSQTLVASALRHVTGADGLFSFDLKQGIQIAIDIPQMDQIIIGTVPNLASVDYTQIS